MLSNVKSLTLDEKELDKNHWITSVVLLLTLDKGAIKRIIFARYLWHYLHYLMCKTTAIITCCKYCFDSTDK